MAVILNNKKSTNGSPYAFYTVETTNITNRTQTSVDISFKITVNLQYAESVLGTNRPLTGGLYLNGTWNTFVIKNSSAYWSGTTKHYINATITITDLTPTQTSITGVQFRSVGSSSYGATLSATGCSDITIPIGHTPPELEITSLRETNQDLLNAGVSHYTFVANMSQKQFRLKGTFYDNANAQSYTVKWLDASQTLTTSSGTPQIDVDFRNKPLTITNNKVNMTYMVTDTMGAITEFTPSYSYDAIPYTLPTLSSTTSVKRYGQTSGLVRLNIAGTYFNGTIGNTTNDIAIRYRYYEVGATPSVTDHYISSADITKSDGTFQVSSYEIGSTTETDPNYFDYTKSYVVEIYVDDSFNTTTTSKRITKGVPVWSEYSDRVWFEKAVAKNVYATEGIYLNGEPIGTGSKSIMTGMMNANYTLSTQNATKLTLVANSSISSGTGLSISNGGIKIGAGITKVLVNAQIHFAEGGTGSSRRGVQIFQNSHNIAYCNINNVRTYTGASISPLLLEVEENDIIYLYGLNQGTTGSQIQASNSWLTVEVVE